MSATEEFINMPKRAQAYLLRRAANIIDSQPYLAKHSYEDSKGCHCMAGALGMAVCGNPRAFAYDARMYSGPADKSPFAELLVKRTCSSMEGFNDHSSTTQKMVSHAFRKMAAKLEHGGSIGERKIGV